MLRGAEAWVRVDCSAVASRGAARAATVVRAPLLLPVLRDAEPLRRLAVLMGLLSRMGWLGLGRLSPVAMKGRFFTGSIAAEDGGGGLAARERAGVVGGKRGKGVRRVASYVLPPNPLLALSSACVRMRATDGGM